MMRSQHKRSAVILAMAVGLAACDGAGDGSVTLGTAEETTDVGEWILNTDDRSAEIYESSTTNTGVLFDVQVAESRTLDGVEYQYVEATGIPRYDVEITQEALDALTGRPLAATDFLSGSPTVNVGDTVVFGQDIGYATSTGGANTACLDTGGYGHWPPGPDCPIDTSKTQYFAVEPAAATEQCPTGLGVIGLMVNGTSIFNWGDGQSYNNQNVFYNLAPVAEQFDVDICGGHAASGEYHHHFYTQCLADLVGDDGTAHSPLYGYASDGYPIYGPWEDDGVLAVSGWAARDYGASTALGGCGTPGERTCTLNDNTDLSAGVDATVSAGPDIGDPVSTLSGNTLPADDGYYYEDYYYTGTAAVGAQLDEHNGHDNGDGHGYHYHITLTYGAGGDLQPSFPYIVGPDFAGELDDNAGTQCTVATGPGPGGPGPGGDQPLPGADLPAPDGAPELAEGELPPEAEMI